MKPLSRAANCFYFIWDLKVFLDTKFKLQCCYYCCCWGKAGEEASIYSEPVLPSILNQWYHILWTSTIYLFWTSATHITLNQYNLSGHPEPMWPTYNVYHLSSEPVLHLWFWTSATYIWALWIRTIWINNSTNYEPTIATIHYGYMLTNYIW